MRDSLGDAPLTWNRHSRAVPEAPNSKTNANDILAHTFVWNNLPTCQSSPKSFGTIISRNGRHFERMCGWNIAKQPKHNIQIMCRYLWPNKEPVFFYENKKFRWSAHVYWWLSCDETWSAQEWWSDLVMVKLIKNTRSCPNRFFFPNEDSIMKFHAQNIKTNSQIKLIAICFFEQSLFSTSSHTHDDN